MRDLIVSTLAVALLIGSWLVFYNYSEEKIDFFTDTIQDVILPMVEEESWSDSNQEMSLLNESWHKYKKIALLFLDTQAINEIDYSMAKSTEYIKARDVSNSSGELLVMHEQLKFLSSNDKVSLSNIL